MGTDVRITQLVDEMMAEFVCRNCPLSLGQARVDWGRLPILDYRNDPDGGFVSAKERNGGDVLPEGVSFDVQLREGMSRMMVPQSGRKTWERVERDGVWWLLWSKGCHCGRAIIAYPEEEIRSKVNEARIATAVRPVPVPI